MVAWRESHRAETRDKARAKRAANIDAMREADRQYRLAHPDQTRQSKRAYRASSKGRTKERMSRRRHYELNKTALAAKHLDWARRNPGICNAITMKRWAAKLNATPEWADHSAIEAIYTEAARLTRTTGIPHEVDHVYPLQSPLVCGLHIAANLQILTKADNIRKHNRMPTHVVNSAAFSDTANRIAAQSNFLESSGLAVGVTSCVGGCGFANGSPASRADSAANE